MSTISKADLLAVKFGVEEVEIPDVGTVKVRALTRGEALQIGGKELPIEEVERFLLATAMVEPKLTEAEVEQWHSNAPAGMFEPIVTAITRLSGMEQTSAKEAVQTFRD